MAKTRKAKLKQEDEEEEEDSESAGSVESDREENFCQACGEALPANAQYCGRCGEKRPSVRRRVTKRSCACCAGITCLALVAIVAVLTITFNQWLKYAIEAIGGALTGTAVTLSAVNLNLIEGRVSLTDLAVMSPSGYEGDHFMFLHRFVFDVGPSTLWSNPILLEEATLNDLEVFIALEILPSPKSNAGDVLNHVMQVTGQVAPSLTTLPPLPDAETTLHIMERKIQVNRLTLANVSVTSKLALMPEVTFKLAAIQLADIGKQSNGVYMFQFMDILIQAVLMAVVKGAPETVQAAMAAVFGQDLTRGLDVGGIHVDLGHGLEEITEFSGWVAAQAAMLPIRMAGAGASMTEKALEFGTKLTNWGTNVQVAATNAQVGIGVKATEEMAKLSNDFVTGFTKAMTGTR